MLQPASPLTHPFFAGAPLLFTEPHRVLSHSFTEPFFIAYLPLSPWFSVPNSVNLRDPSASVPACAHTLYTEPHRVLSQSFTEPFFIAYLPLSPWFSVPFSVHLCDPSTSVPAGAKSTKEQQVQRIKRSHRMRTTNFQERTNFIRVNSCKFVIDLPLFNENNINQHHP